MWWTLRAMPRLDMITTSLSPLEGPGRRRANRLRITAHVSGAMDKVSDLVWHTGAVSPATMVPRSCHRFTRTGAVSPAT